MSLVEAIANVVIGYGIAVVTQLLVFPWFGLRAHLDDALALGAVFTLIGRSGRSCFGGCSRRSREAEPSSGTKPITVRSPVCSFPLEGVFRN